jgi:hypothetical protein
MAHVENPTGQGGASSVSFGSEQLELDRPFTSHRQAALALLNRCPNLSHKEASFLGHVCVADALSDKQRDWLAKLLERHGLPPLAEGGAR